MSKRIKSFFISLCSFVVASLPVIVLSPEWADFTAWLGSTSDQALLGLGVPAVVIIVLGKLIDEVWRQVLNRYIVKSKGYRTTASWQARSDSSIDMY